MNKDVKEENSFEKLIEKFRIAQGMNTQEHIKLLQTLEKLPERDLVLIFNNFLKLETNPDILIYLIRVLSRYKDEETIDILSEMLMWKEDFRPESNYKEDDNIKLRCFIATAVGNFKNNKGVMPLLYVLNSKHENYKLRLSCAEALGKIGNTYAVAPLINVVSDEDEKSVYLKESAARALGMLGDERAVDSLVSILETKNGLIDKFTFLKERIIESLGRLGGKGNERSFKALKDALMDEAAYIRLGAIEALAEIEDDRVIPLIEKMLEDEDEEVARTAVGSLHAILGTEYTRKLTTRENLAGWCINEAECILEEELKENEDYD